jgi:hypothetical protein
VGLNGGGRRGEQVVVLGEARGTAGGEPVGVTGTVEVAGHLQQVGPDGPHTDEPEPPTPIRHRPSASENATMAAAPPVRDHPTHQVIMR